MLAFIVALAFFEKSVFIPVVASGLAQAAAATRGLERDAMLALSEAWKSRAVAYFNWGGLLGTLLTVPAAKLLGRRVMFGIYYLLSAVAIFATFGLDLPPETRLALYFWIGLTVFGVFGSFTYYLPELFPTRLRASGAGFCYNAGRILAAFGPFWVGSVAARGADSTMNALFAVGFVPLAGLLLLPWVVETRGRALED